MHQKSYSQAPASGYIATLCIGLLGIVYGLLLMTDFTFNFFLQDDFSLTYNYVFLSMLEGRLDIPANILQNEAFYDHVGNAFSYFGTFPALLRALFYPFVDLTTISVSRLIVFFAVTATGITAQLTFNKAIEKYSYTDKKLQSLFTVSSLMIWFLSPIPILYGNGSIYHEPIALGLLGVTLYVYYIVLLTLIHDKATPENIAILALIAGIVLHCRPTMGIGLYAATCLLVALKAWNFIRQHRGGQSQQAAALAICKHVVAPLLILFLFGCFVLLKNYISWGSIFTSAPMDRYGFYLFEEGNSERMLGFFEHGRFNLRRIIPSIAFNLFGFSDIFGKDIYRYLMDTFDTGYMRIEGTYPMMIYWAPWLIAAVGLPIIQSKKIITKGYALYCLYAGLAASVLLMLCYPTITVRYRTEYWPILFLSFVIIAAKVVSRPRSTTRRASTLSYLFYIILGASLILNTRYTLKYGAPELVNDLASSIPGFILG